jgi:hypothetical protein
MIEQREFTKEEFYTILESAPEGESDDLIRSTRQIGKLPWEFFQEFGLGQWGILINNVPVYFVCVYVGEDDTYRMWTLRKKVIKEQFTLFKLCKRKLEGYPLRPIYTNNYVRNKKEAKWNMRLGFVPYKVENDVVFYKLGG